MGVCVKAVGWVMVTEAVSEHPFLSVTVTVYVMPDKSEADCAVETVEVPLDQL